MVLVVFVTDVPSAQVFPTKRKIQAKMKRAAAQGGRVRLQ